MLCPHKLLFLVVYGSYWNSSRNTKHEIIKSFRFIKKLNTYALLQYKVSKARDAETHVPAKLSLVCVKFWLLNAKLIELHFLPYFCSFCKTNCVLGYFCIFHGAIFVWLHFWPRAQIALRKSALNICQYFCVLSLLHN